MWYAVNLQPSGFGGEASSVAIVVQGGNFRANNLVLASFGNMSDIAWLSVRNHQ
jgi:hypothetical protein